MIERQAINDLRAEKHMFRDIFLRMDAEVKRYTAESQEVDTNIKVNMNWVYTLPLYFYLCSNCERAVKGCDWKRSESIEV